MYRPHFAYPLIRQWTLVLFPPFGFWEECCCEHEYTDSSLRHCFQLFSVYPQKWNCWIMLILFLTFFFFNFIFGCIGSSLLCVGLSLVVASGGYSSLRCEGFSLRWLLLLQSMGSRHAGFSSCGTRAELLRGMWDLPGPGLEPVSPALAGRFSTTAPPGRPHSWLFEEPPSCCPQQLHHFTFLPAVHKGSDVSMSWPTLVVFCCFDCSHPGGCEGVSRGVLMCISLISLPVARWCGRSSHQEAESVVYPLLWWLYRHWSKAVPVTSLGPRGPSRFPSVTEGSPAAVWRSPGCSAGGWQTRGPVTPVAVPASSWPAARHMWGHSRPASRLSCPWTTARIRQAWLSSEPSHWPTAPWATISDGFLSHGVWRWLGVKQLLTGTSGPSACPRVSFPTFHGLSWSGTEQVKLSPNSWKKADLLLSGI